MKKNKNCGIYFIRNKINNKIYVGSSKNLYNREKEHFSDLRKGKHHNIYLQRAYNKYGEKNFVFEVIETCKEDERLDIEQQYIDKFISSNNCYNINKNAILPPTSNKKKIYCIELKKTFNSIEDGAKFMNTPPSNISVCLVNHNRTACGYHWITLEDKEKMSDQELFLITKHTNANFKDIICLDDNKIYYNSEDICRAYDIKYYMQIKRCCEGIQNTAKGHHFMFYEDYINKTQKEIEYIKKQKYKNKKSVKCITTNQVFESITEASKKTGAHIPNILNCCLGKQKETKGLKFIYLDS
jgi:group I intron endonuclease